MQVGVLVVVVVIDTTVLYYCLHLCCFLYSAIVTVIFLLHGI